MKFIVSLGTVVILTFSAKAQGWQNLPIEAQKEPLELIERGDFFIDINPISIALFSINVQGEVLLSDNLSINLTGISVHGPSYGNTFYNGFGIIPSIKFYGKRGTKSINFLEPTIRFLHFESVSYQVCCGGGDDIDWAKLSSIGIGFNAGRLIRVSKVIFVEVVGGLYYSYSNLNTQNFISGPIEFDVPFVIDGFSPNFSVRLNFKI